MHTLGVQGFRGLGFRVIVLMRRKGRKVNKTGSLGSRQGL